MAIRYIFYFINSPHASRHKINHQVKKEVTDNEDKRKSPRSHTYKLTAKICVARSATIRAVTVPVWAMVPERATGDSLKSEWRERREYQSRGFASLHLYIDEARSGLVEPNIHDNLIPISGLPQLS